jgi:hypothetical protein
MRTGTTPLLLAAAGALALLLAPSDAGATPRTGVLSRSGMTTGEDASGRVRIGRGDGRGAALLVRLRHLDPLSSYEVRDAQGGGSLGSVPTNRRGGGRLRVSSQDIPGGRPALLAGMALEVVHEGTGEVVLEGEVPHGGHEGGDQDGDAGTGVREAAAVFESDGGARAVMAIRSDPDHGSERMALRVAGIEGDGDLVLFVADGEGTMHEVAGLVLHDGEKHCERHVEGEHVVEACWWTHVWEWSVDTADGDSLPLDAESLDGLVGHGFEVRDHEGHAVLHGEVPHFREHEDGDGEEPPAEVQEGGAEFSSDGGAHAAIWIRSDPAHGSERLALKASGLGDGTFHLFMADGEEGMDDVAALALDGEYLWYWVDTAQGGVLPFGVESVGSLSGRAFQIRDAEGHVRLVGEVPHFRVDDPPPVVREAGATFGPDSDGGVHGWMGLRSDPANRSERIWLKVDGLPETGHYVLFMGDGQDGMDDVAVLVRDGGYWWYWVDTAHEGVLPFGVDGVAGLSGRRIEIRDGEGHVVLSGEIPHFAE